MHAEPQTEHQWLNQLVGEWTCEMECSMGPDQPPSKSTGVEVVRSLGGLWTIGEGQGESPEGPPVKSIMTLGYDPQKKRYVGSFIASVMNQLWLYEGTLDESGKKLTLDTEGPAFDDQGMPNPKKGAAKYQDVIEIISPDHRIMKSQILGDDGQWHQFMTAHYRRK